MEISAESICPVVDVGSWVTDVKGLPIDSFPLLFQQGDYLVGDIAHVAIAANDRFAARVKIEASACDAPKFLRVSRMPRAPYVGRPNNYPFAAQIGASGLLFGDDFALTVDGSWKVVFIV